MHLVLGIVQRDLSSQIQDSTFRGTVGDRPSADADVAEHARDVDDVASSLRGGMEILFEELREGMFAAEEDAAEVDGHDLVPGGRWHGMDARRACWLAEAGIVDYAVRSTGRLVSFSVAGIN